MQSRTVAYLRIYGTCLNTYIYTHMICRQINIYCARKPLMKHKHTHIEDRHIHSWTSVRKKRDVAPCMRPRARKRDWWRRWRRGRGKCVGKWAKWRSNSPPPPSPICLHYITLHHYVALDFGRTRRVMHAKGLACLFFLCRELGEWFNIFILLLLLFYHERKVIPWWFDPVSHNVLGGWEY